MPFADNKILNIICMVIGVALTSYLMGVIVSDTIQSVTYPLPHDYGEGILAWMTREFFEGRYPYGDITAVPSRYACYGPLPAWIASIFCHFLGEDNMKFVWSGRILNTIYWLGTGTILGLLCRPKLGALFMTPVIILAISHLSFMCSFRVDSLMILLEAAILYVLVRQRQQVLLFSLPVLVSALTLVKPTAALDLGALVLLGFALGAQSWKEYLTRIVKPGILAIIWAPSIFFTVDLFYHGWMSNNILSIQRISGWAEPYSPDMMTNTFFMTASIWPLVLWALWGPSTHPQAKTRLAFVALALGLLLNGSLALKYGAVTNYYFPLLVLMLGAASLWMRTNVQMVVFLGVITMAALPLSKQGGPFRNQEVGRERIAEQSRRITEIHKTNHIISEDVFFSVLAGYQTMISDIFQYNLVATQKKIANRELLEATQGFWGDFRVRHLLGRAANDPVRFIPPDFTPAFVPAPPYLRGMTFGIDKVDPVSFKEAPFTPKYDFPFRSYLRNCLVPVAVLLFAALFWDSRQNGLWKIK
jgi:hypothetical protein